MPRLAGYYRTLLAVVAFATPCGWDAPSAAGESANAVNVSVAQEVTFERDVQPLLTRFGCNSGPCHGKARGQNGFALSLLGFDSDFDYDAIVRQARGRRLSPAAPEASLLLQKALGVVPHGGGVRFESESKPHRLLRRWIAEGAPQTPVEAAATGAGGRRTSRDRPRSATTDAAFAS